MTELPFPLVGRTLIIGPSNVGKTKLTARALETWLKEFGSAGVVVFEFGPEYEHKGRLLGGQLSRFIQLPDTVWTGIIDAHAPRAAANSPSEAARFAKRNATRAMTVFEQAPPDPTAVFINDITIPFQHDRGELEVLIRYCRGAELVVANAYAGAELGSADRISHREQRVLEHLQDWSDRVIELDHG